MSFYKSLQIYDPCFSSTFTSKTLTLPSPSYFFHDFDDLTLPFDLLSPSPVPFDRFDSVTDLIQVQRTPSLSSYKRVQRRAGAELLIQNLCDRVSSLESSFDRLVNAKVNGGERKYTWTAEIKGDVERKYKWTAEIKEAEKKKPEERKYKWTAEIKGRDETRKYTFETASGSGDDESVKKEEKEKEKEKDKKKKKKEKKEVRLVEIEDEPGHGAVVLRQAFAKRAGASKARKGKHKELSPQDAAILIQITFRAYLTRRSQVLRALRELAIAKSKLKELRALFNNFSYRRLVARDAEERQRFSEKIIVLLLTVDAIEGADQIVRAAKRSMVDELEAMLDVVDPQPQGKSVSMRRRTFDMPDGVIRKEIADGVAQVVEMLEREENSTSEGL